MKTYGIAGIFAAVLLATLAVVLTFACRPADEDGGGSTGGIISPSKNKDILVRIGNSTVTFTDVIADSRFKQLMAEKIFSAILVDKGKKDRIEVTDEEINKAIDRIKKGFPDEAMFEKTMADYGFTMEKFRDEQRRFLVLEKILRDRLQLTDEDIRDYYDRNKRMVDQQYGSDNGLTEEETANLTYETCQVTADQLCYQEKGNELFPKVREELIREYLPAMQFLSMPAMTLKDFGIIDPEAAATEVPGADAGARTVDTGEAGTGDAAAPGTPDASASEDAGTGETGESEDAGAAGESAGDGSSSGETGEGSGDGGEDAGETGESAGETGGQ